MLQYINLLFLSLLIVVLMLACTGNNEKVSSNQLEKALGKELYNKVSKAKIITVVRIKPQLKYTPENPMETVGGDVKLNYNERADLLDLLTSDENFNFEVMKKCVFLPEILITLKGAEEVQVLVNVACSQLKITDGEESKLLDYEPAKEDFNAFFSELNIGEPAK